MKLEHVQKDFNRSVKSYDAVGILQQKVAKKTSEIFREQRFPLSDGAKIVDLGAGTGALARQLPEYHVYQLDCAYQMCESAVRSGKVVNANMEYLPFKKGVFEAAISSLAIQWCEDYQALFREINHVVGGGRAVLSTLGEGTLKELKACFATLEGSAERVMDFMPIAEIVSNIEGEYEVIHAPIIMQYTDFSVFLKSIRDIGGANKRASRKRAITRKNLQKLKLNYMDNYSCKGGIYATWDVYYIILKG